jgi:hypothetical protein
MAFLFTAFYNASVIAILPCAIYNLYGCFPNVLIASCGPPCDVAMSPRASDSDPPHIPNLRQSKHNQVPVKQALHKLHLPAVWLHTLQNNLSG